MPKGLVALIAALLALAPLATPASASGNQPPTLGIAGTGGSNTAYYVDWLSANAGAGTASGVITLPGGAQVNLSFSAVGPDGSVRPYAFGQTGCGANFWNPSTPYVSTEVPNAPPPCDLLALSGGNDTIYRVNLSKPIRDPIMSIVSLGSSWNYTTYDFDSPFTILSQGTGYFGGDATRLVQLPGNVLRGNEGHGTIKFLGTFSTFSWTVPTNEYWHGFTFAIRASDAFDLAPSEGQTAANYGTWGDPDPGDTVTLSASVGTVTANPDGTWAWSYATTDGPAQSQTVTITATDAQGATTSQSFALVVKNLPPTATLGNDGPVNIGAPATISFSGQADPSSVDLASLHYAYSCTGSALTGTTYAGSSASPSGSCTFAAPGPATVLARVIDKDGAFSEYTTVVTVTNLAPPTVSAGGPTSVDEGGTVTLQATGTDPGGATIAYAWDLDDNGTFETPGQSVTFSAAALDGPTSATVHVRGCNPSALCGTDSAVVTVNNVAPAVATPTLSAATINEDQTVTLSGSFADPGTLDSHSVVIRWGDGSPDTTIPLAAGTLGYSATHRYLDDDPSATASDSYGITVTVTDDDGGVGTAGTNVTVNNVAPSVGPLSATSSPIQVNTPVSASAAFTDPGTRDTFTASFDWGDGSTTAGTTAGSLATGTHTYLSPGLYVITATVTDDDGGVGTTTATQYLVVYDPSAGFVTGGGWINSPAGSLPADPSQAGQARFGFVAKYKPGRTVPEGNTELHVGSLNFKSTAYDWLVVAGAKAVLKGTGTINGSGTYSFILTTIDGGTGGADTFRIKISSLSGVVYDSGLGASDLSDPAIALGGGSIVLHR